MSEIASRELRIAAGSPELDALETRPENARAYLLLAHGAGAGMRHAFLEAAAAALAARGVATLRFQFPWMQRGERRIDPAPVLHAALRAAFAEATRAAGGLPLFAGGKSLGGRMTSQVAAQGGLSAARGIVFLGFPLHLTGKPGIERAAHLREVTQPMLFVQGTRDALADLQSLQPLIDRLGNRATLRLFQDADHAFHVPARTGRKDAGVRREMLDALSAWIETAAALAT